MIRDVLLSAEVQLAEPPPLGPPDLEDPRWYTPVAVRRLVRPFAPGGPRGPALRIALLDAIRDLRAKMAELKLQGRDRRPYRPVASDDRAVVHFAIGVFPLCAWCSYEGDDPRAMDAWWELNVTILVDDDLLE
jgi:hypothetical protein